MGTFGTAIQAGISTGTALKTLLQLTAGTNAPVWIREVGISFNGVDPINAPILVQLLIQTGGTMTSLTLVHKDRRLATTFLSTAKHTATSEPTPGQLLRHWYVHPQSGLVYPIGNDNPMTIASGTILGLAVTAANSVTATAYIDFEE